MPLRWLPSRGGGLSSASSSGDSPPHLAGIRLPRAVIRLLVARLGVAVLGPLLVGCDPGWSIVVHNQSDQTVLIAVDDGSRTVAYAPGGSVGFVSGGLGKGHRGLSILEPDCTVRQTLETADHGVFRIEIGRDGSATVRDIRDSEVDADAVSYQELGGVCGAYKSWCASEPLPSDIPPPKDVEVIEDC